MAKLNSVKSSTNPTFSNKDRALEAKVEQLEKQVIKLQEENRVLESYEKRSRERLEKMQQEQSVASEKSKLDAQNALASGDITTLQKQLRESISEQDKAQAVVESLQGEISDMKAILLNTEHKLQEKEQQVENLKLECEDLKESENSSTSPEQGSSPDSTLLEELNEIRKKLENEKLQLVESRANNDHLETEMEEMRDVIKKLELEVDQKGVELEIANAKAIVVNSSTPSGSNMANSGDIHPDEPKILKKLKESVSKGKAMWKAGNKQGCYNEYMKTAEEVLGMLPGTTHCKKFKVSFKTEIQHAKVKSAGPGAILLRKLFKGYQEDANGRLGISKSAKVSDNNSNTRANEEEVKRLEMKLAAIEKEKLTHEVQAGAKVKSASSKSPRPANNRLLNQKIKQLEQRSINAENRVKELEHELSESIKSGGTSTMASSSRQTGNNKNNQKVVNDLKAKVKALEKQLKEDKVKIKQVENKLEKAEQNAAKHAGGDTGGKAALERRIKEMEKKHKKSLEELETTHETICIKLRKTSKENYEGKRGTKYKFKEYHL